MDRSDIALYKHMNGMLYPSKVNHAFKKKQNNTVTVHFINYYTCIYSCIENPEGLIFSFQYDTFLTELEWKKEPYPCMSAANNLSITS